MRVINKSQKLECIEKMATSVPLPADITDKHPCWYVDVDRQKKKTKWTVGVKHAGKTEEYSFSIESVDDEKEFAVKIIELFRNGGRKAVRDWIKNGR
jgi:hypothetical protein